MCREALNSGLRSAAGLGVLLHGSPGHETAFVVDAQETKGFRASQSDKLKVDVVEIRPRFHFLPSQSALPAHFFQTYFPLLSDLRAQVDNAHLRAPVGDCMGRTLNSAALHHDDLIREVSDCEGLAKRQHVMDD